jgi:hypothetical protein
MKNTSVKLTPVVPVTVPKKTPKLTAKIKVIVRQPDLNDMPFLYQG